MASKTRILIVDDSRTFRSALQEALAGQDDMAVVGSVWNGQKALEFIQSTPPEIVVLDLAMPGMDGVETLRGIQQINASRPGSTPVAVIVVSGYLDTRGDSATLAKQEGVLNVVAKPIGPSPEENMRLLSKKLVETIRFWNGRHKGGAVSPAPSAPPSPRRTGLRTFKGVLIAVSTGGPEALTTLLPGLCQRIEQPILIVQHMMPGMLSGLVKSLDGKCPWPVVEAMPGSAILPKHIYFAPTGRHLVLRKDTAGVVIAHLTDQPEESTFRPSADVLFRSAAHVWGGEVMVLILTGMLRDGTAGLEPLKRNGAYVIAQDRPSSVVWGMPGSAIAAGLVDEVVALDRMALAVGSVINAVKRD